MAHGEQQAHEGLWSHSRGVVLTGLGLAAAALWAIVPALAAATGGISLLIPAIAAGVGALVAGFILFGKTIKDFLRKVWAKMLSKIGAGLKKLSKLVSIFSDDWAEAMADAAEGLEDTADGMAAAAKAAAKAEKAAAKLAKEQEKAAGAAAELAEAQAEVAEAATEAAEAAEEAAKAAAKEAKAVQDLADSWTGATLDSGKFLRAYQSLTPAQKENDRIMAQVLNKYDSLRKVHGPFNKELEAQWQATVRLNPELAALNKEQEKLEKAAQALNERLADQRRRLLGLPTDAARRAFEELTRVWDAMSADEQARGMENYRKVLRSAAAASHFLNDAQLALIESTETAKAGASGYELALAGIAGEMGDATEQGAEPRHRNARAQRGAEGGSVSGQKDRGVIQQYADRCREVGLRILRGRRCRWRYGWKNYDRTRKYRLGVCDGRRRGRHHGGHWRGRQGAQEPLR